MPRFLPHLFYLLCGSFLLVSCGAGRVLTTGRGPEDLVRVHLRGGDGVLTGTVERGLIVRRFPWGHGRLELFRPGHDQGFHTVFSAARRPGRSGNGFAPVGMDVVYNSSATGLKGKQLVYVINHASATRGTRTVEVFNIDPKGAITHEGSLGDSPCIALANGIAAASDGCVYVSNFPLVSLGRHRPVAVEAGCGSKVSNTIACFRPETGAHSALKGTWSVVASGFKGVNGLALTQDERHLLVNSFDARKIDAFTRVPGRGGRLTSPQEVVNELPFSPDNLKRQEDGSFIVAGARNSLAAAPYFLFWGWVPCWGGGARFHWKSDMHCGAKTERVNIGKDAWAPSGATQVGNHLYVSRIVHSGVREVDVETGAEADLNDGQAPPRARRAGRP